MNNTFFIRCRRGLALTAVLLLLAAMAPSLWAGGRTCREALDACLGDALKTAVFMVNPELGAVFAFGCLVGYDWCTKYYAPRN